LVKATVYRGIDESIIAVAGWGPRDLVCDLRIDWKGLGLNPQSCRVTVPPISGFQEGQRNVPLERLTIPAGKGYLILLETPR
ncbi:MAG: hypothetical protein H6Q32_1200, partial [Bacteroidetes bacterium]|nr:hypothetical protein [Bacteroidota bacterium]